MLTIPPKSPITSTSVRLPRQLLERLDDMARETGRSRSDVLRHVVEHALADAAAKSPKRR